MHGAETALKTADSTHTLLKPNFLGYGSHGHVIYTADHEPPHAHVYGEGEARIDIVSLVVLTQGGMSDRDVRRAVAVIEENRKLFMETWRRYHG